MHSIKYRPDADVEHDAAVGRVVREFDGAAWLQEHALRCISVIVEFTEDGANHWGKPIKTPAHVEYSRIDDEGQINVSSHVPLEMVGSLSAGDREPFWFDWYAEIVSVLSRRRRLGTPRRRSDAEIAAMPPEPENHYDEAEDDDPPFVMEVHVPLAAGQRETDSGAEPHWMANVEVLLASLDDPVTLEPSAGRHVDEYVFCLTGAESHAVILAARNIAALPDVPAGAFALFMDGAGVPNSGFPVPLLPELPLA